MTGGKSDPYVKVISGLQIRGRTSVIDNDLNPEWGEIVYVPVHSLREDLLLEVMDWNNTTKDKSLGVAELNMKHLINECTREDEDEGGPVTQKWYEPTPEPVDR
jgi:Ca2+-dependent lipid-binding protein